MDVLRKFWAGWKRFGQFMGDFIGRFVLTIFYFTIVLPFGLIMRFFNDRLDTKEAKPPSWQARETSDKTLEDAGKLS